MKYENLDISILYDLFEIVGSDLVWKKRPRSHFSSDQSFKKWNTMYPGGVAGSNNGKGYLRVTININGGCYVILAHRVVMAMTNGLWPSAEVDIDHIDHNRTNNSPSNLRLVSRKENNRNKEAYKNNKSGVVGVYFDKVKNKWKATGRKGGKSLNLGSYDTISGAIEARKRYLKAEKHHKNHIFVSSD